MRARWQWRRAAPVSGPTMTSPCLREVHERLVRYGSDPLSDPDAAWQDLRAKLPERPLTWSARLMAWLRRPAIAIMTTGLLSTGVAHAAGVQPVRGAVDWLVGGVTSIVKAKGEARDEPDARAATERRSTHAGSGPSEENRRRFASGIGLGPDRGSNGAPAGRGRPVAGGAGSDRDEGRGEPREQGRDRRELEDRDDGEEPEGRDDGDELEDRDDGDDKGRSEPEEQDVEEPDDEELAEPDDEELEEPDDERPEADRGADADERDELEGDAYDDIEPEGAPASP